MNNIPKGLKLAPVDIDALAQFIRKVDGNNRMGAGTLAEHIAEWLDLDAQPIYDEAKERELFNAWYGELPTTKLKETMWMAWEACAQSRAKAGEDE